MQADIKNLIDRLENVNKLLEHGTINLKTLAAQKANAEKNYRIALAKEELRLRELKYPVNLVLDLARGNETVADLKAIRDIAESSYFIAIEGLNNTRGEREVLRSILKQLNEEMKL